MSRDFNIVLSNFCVDGELVSAELYGQGHINETYLVAMRQEGMLKKYIFQRVSPIFRDVPALMRNISLVTEFCREKIIARGGDPDRETLTIISAKDGKPYYFDGAEYFRIYLFIDDAITYQVVEKPEHFYESAIAFGNFVNLLAEFDASQLAESLPDFHNTRVRFNNFCDAVERDPLGRAASVTAEINWVKNRERYADSIVSLLADGQMPLRVTHNDTKLNNVMIDNATGKGLAVIDLDTIMPGSLCYDFGDSIRFGCNPAQEGETDLSKVVFQIDLFEEYVRGYLNAVGASITPVEKSNLATGSILMTYECGMRFLTDHLLGDTYFRISRPNHNLDRARTQFKLVEDMEECFDRLNEIVAKY